MQLQEALELLLIASEASVKNALGSFNASLTRRLSVISCGGAFALACATPETSRFVVTSIPICRDTDRHE